MSWEADKFIVKEVEEGDFIDLKTLITSYIQIDPADTSSIRNVVKYVENNSEEFKFEKHNDKKFKSRASWNKDYVAQLITDLMDNFSKKRFEHILDVGKKVYSKNQGQDNKKTSNKKSARKKKKVKVEVEKKNKTSLPIILVVSLIIIIVIFLILKLK